MVSKTKTFGRQAYQGLTFGFGDELIDMPTAAIVAALTGQKYKDVYNEARDMSKAGIAEDWQQNPGTAILGNITGSLPLAFSAPAKQLANWAATGTRAARAGKGFAAGAGYGAASGFGSAAPDANADLLDALLTRARGTAIGAGVGGVLGAATNALIGSGTSANNVNYSKVGKQVAKQQPTKAQKFMAEQLAKRPDLQDQLARAQGMQTASQNTGIQLTLPEMLAQSPSEPLLAQQRILGTNPQTAGRMEALYAARSGTPNQAGQIEQRLMQLAQQLDPGVGSYDEAANKLVGLAGQKQADITRQLVAQAKPLYDEAYRGFIDPKSTILKNPVIQSALNKVRGNPAYASSMEQAVEGGTLRLKDNSVQVLDAVKRQLDDAASAAAQSGNRNEARLINAARDELLQTLDSAAPAYKQARAIYSGNPDALQMRQTIGNVADIDPMSAKQVGQKLFSGTQQNAQVAAQALGPEGSKTAAAARIYDAMDTARGDPTGLANRIAPDARSTDILRTYAGGNQLDETLNVINQAKIGDKYRYGSPTEPLQQARLGLGDAAGMALDVKTGGVTALIRKAASMIGKGEDPQFYDDMYNLIATPQGMQILEQVASGQNQAVAKQLATTQGRQQLMSLAGTAGRGGAAAIRQSAVPGIMASGYQSQQPQQNNQLGFQSPQQTMQQLPPGFTIQNQRQGLPPGFVIQGAQ